MSLFQFLGYFGGMIFTIRMLITFIYEVIKGIKQYKKYKADSEELEYVNKQKEEKEKEKPIGFEKTRSEKLREEMRKNLYVEVPDSKIAEWEEYLKNVKLVAPKDYYGDDPDLDNFTDFDDVDLDNAQDYDEIDLDYHRDYDDVDLSNN